MKKYTIYILILITFIGFFGFVSTKKASADDYSLNGALGTCTLPVGSPMHWTWNTCFKDNPGTNWVEDSGTCVLHNLSYNSCTDSGFSGGKGVSSVKPSTTDTKWKDDVYGDCTFSNWSNTSCHEAPASKNGPGIFTPVFSGTPPLDGSLPLGTCLMTHVTDYSCTNHGGTMSSTSTVNYGATCTIPNVTQYNCTVTTSTWFKTLIADLLVGTNAGGNVTSTWYAPNTYTAGTVTPIDTSSYTLLQQLPNMTPTVDVTGTTALGSYWNIMIKIFIGLCAVLAVIMVMWGGIEYITSELISSKEEGKKRIMDAIFGLILAIGAWLLLNTINPNLLRTDFSSLISQAAYAQIAGSNSIYVKPASDSARCTPVTNTSSACTVANLTGTFGSNATSMSKICNVESSGNANNVSGTDKGTDGQAFSFGLYQINLLANGSLVTGTNGESCTNLFVRSDGSAIVGGNYINKSSSGAYSYNAMVAPGKQNAYNDCKAALLNPATNIKVASQLKLSAWKYSDNAVCPSAFQ